MKWLTKLNTRERAALGIGSVAVLAFLFIELLISPLLADQKRLDRMIDAKRRTLAEMQSLADAYRRLNDQSRSVQTQFSARPRNFTLFSFMDQSAGKSGVKEHIAYMKPSKTRVKDSPFQVSKVELKLQGVTMGQLIPYLHTVETSAYMIFIQRISITKTGKEGVIDAVIQAETFEA